MRPWLKVIGLLCVVEGIVLSGVIPVAPTGSRSYGTRIMGIVGATGEYRSVGMILFMIGLVCFLMSSLKKK